MGGTVASPDGDRFDDNQYKSNIQQKGSDEMSLTCT